MNVADVPERLEGLGEEARDLLRGAIDLHVHAAPDPFAERRMDARELVRACREAGIAGVVLKSHEYPTQPLAWALNEEIDGIDVYGALALDHGVGGLNPDALEAALRIGTRVVWMPTFDSGWSRERFGRWHSKAGPITVLGEDGVLLPVVHELLDLVAEHDAVLCSGHLSPDETLALLRESRGRGIRSLLTHATSFFIPLEVQQEVASLKAFIEQCSVPTFREGGAKALEEVVSDVRAVGAEHVVLSTDLGQANTPPPHLGFGVWIQRFLDSGFSPDEVRRMVQRNPAELLG